MFGLNDPSSKDWTHTNIRITDIRKLSEYYIYTVDHVKDALNGESGSTGIEVKSPLMTKDKVFEERLKPYFLKDAFRVTRGEILSVKWNMYITKGYYIKIARGEVHKYNMDSEKYYVSYLDIAGPLGTFASIGKDKDLHLK